MTLSHSLTGAVSASVGGTFERSALTGHVMKGVQCSGSESGLQHCSVMEWGSKGACQQEHSYASVVCQRECSASGVQLM